MDGLVLCWRPRVFSSAAWFNQNRVVARAFSIQQAPPFSSAAWFNQNRVVSRAFSIQQAPPIDQEGVVGGVGSLMKEAEASENWELFKSWMLKHNRNYKSEKETLRRFKIFCKSKKDVDRSNKESTGCTFALNFFADLTPKECSRYSGKLPRDSVLY